MLKLTTGVLSVEDRQNDQNLIPIAGLSTQEINEDSSKPAASLGPSAVQPALTTQVVSPKSPLQTSSNTNANAYIPTNNEVYPDCPVCLEEMVDPSICPCGHTFCGRCIDRWIKIKENCPLCRKPVKTVPSIRKQIAIIDLTVASVQRSVDPSTNRVISNYMPSHSPVTGRERKSRWSRFWRKFKRNRRV